MKSKVLVKLMVVLVALAIVLLLGTSSKRVAEGLHGMYVRVCTQSTTNGIRIHTALGLPIPFNPPI